MFKPHALFPLLLATLAFAGSACSTRQRLTAIERPTAPPDLAGLAGVTVAAADGRTLSLGAPRDYGSAWCGANGCILKSDVAAFRHIATDIDPVASLGGAVALYVTAPVWAPLLGGALAICVTTQCDSPGHPVRRIDGVVEPDATDLDRARAWLDGTRIVDGKVKATGIANGCTLPWPGLLSDKFETDAAAFAWLWDHRGEAPLVCLSSAASFLQAQTGDPAAIASGRRLWAFHQVRQGWVGVHCADTGARLAATRRITPPLSWDVARGKGDPSALAVITEALADPTAIDWRADAATLCRAGLAPEASWPTREAHAARRDPFAAPDGAPFR